MFGGQISRSDAGQGISDEIRMGRSGKKLVNVNEKLLNFLLLALFNTDTSAD